MAKVVTMGEIMLRLSTPGNEKFIQADEFDVCYGGGEANVAVSLANYGHDAEFVTKVPKNPIGECAVAALRKMNVGTQNIAYGGERLGIYFLETGAAMRASNVVYDRAHSSISTATAEDFEPLTFEKKYYLGDSHPQIVALKERLRVLRYFGGDMDEYFDATLDAAVKRFQADTGLYPCGDLDFTTQTTINNLVLEAKVIEDTQLEKAYEYLTKK